MKKILSALVVILMANMAHAAALTWNHEENIQQGVKLFDAAYKQGGMTEIILSKDCHKTFAKSKDVKLHELCAAIDLAAMMIDVQMVPQASLQNKYFQRKAMEGRLRKELSTLGHNRKIQENILKFWADTTSNSLNTLANEPASETPERQ